MAGRRPLVTAVTKPTDRGTSSRNKLPHDFSTFSTRETQTTTGVQLRNPMSVTRWLPLGRRHHHHILHMRTQTLKEVTVTNPGAQELSLPQLAVTQTWLREPQTTGWNLRGYSLKLQVCQGDVSLSRFPGFESTLSRASVGVWDVGRGVVSRTNFGPTGLDLDACSAPLC